MLASRCMMDSPTLIYGSFFSRGGTRLSLGACSGEAGREWARCVGRDKSRRQCAVGWLVVVRLRCEARRAQRVGSLGDKGKRTSQWAPLPGRLPYTANNVVLGCPPSRAAWCEPALTPEDSLTSRKVPWLRRQGQHFLPRPASSCVVRAAQTARRLPVLPRRSAIDLREASPPRRRHPLARPPPLATPFACFSAAHCRQYATREDTGWSRDGRACPE